MRKVVIGMLLGIILVSCGKKEGTVLIIETEAVGPPIGLVVLLELKEEGLIPIDTLELKDGVYETSLIPTSENFYRVVMSSTQFVNLVLSADDDEVSVKFQGTKKIIEGSDNSVLANDIDVLMEKGKLDAGQLNREAMAANQQGDQVAIQAIIDQYEDLQKGIIGTLKEKIAEAGSSLVALYGLNFIDMDSEYSYYDSIVAKVIEKNPDHFWPKSLSENLDKIRALSIGQMAPNFTLNTLEDQPVSLSDFKGKYVLIDFWAAWCRPCRQENPNVVKAYQKYGGDKFEILGVSLDRTKEAWEKAIAEDGLKWKHVSDLQYFNSEAARLYNISAIPATYLVDPEGRILAKNLRGASLDAKLIELFGE